MAKQKIKAGLLQAIRPTTLNKNQGVSDASRLKGANQRLAVMQSGTKVKVGRDKGKKAIWEGSAATAKEAGAGVKKSRLGAAKVAGGGAVAGAGKKAAPHALQRGKKGGSFYVVNGKKVYAKK